MPITRRALLEALAGLGLLGACRPTSTARNDDVCAVPPSIGAGPVNPSSFRHGVASGNPGPDRVILWTRVEPLALSEGHVEVVEYTVARDPELLEVVARGQVETSAARDYTIKIDVDGLEPGTTYFYQFARARSSPCAETRTATPLGPPAPIQASSIGRTKTLPIGPLDRLALGFCSCANYPQGYFNAYAALALRDELAAVLHLGDYLYEYADGRYGDGARLGRLVEPAGETVTLADYRARHAIYKRDPDLRAVHAKHPFIAVWDDHELANDATTHGAENHDPSSQGDWPTRLAAAIQAYYEWMPIREPNPALYRQFRFGDLVDLLMLDTRVVGREAQAVKPEQLERLADPERTILGPEQEAWLFAGLSASAEAKIPWRVIGQQVVFGGVTFDPGKPPYPDSWDGYPAARTRLLEQLRREAIGDVVVLSGDIHSSWAIEVSDDPWSSDPAKHEPRLVEFVTPAISSPGPVPAERAESMATELAGRHPHVKWIELERRGYVTLDITVARIEARWWFIDTVDERRPDESLAKAIVVERGAAKLLPADQGP